MQIEPRTLKKPRLATAQPVSAMQRRYPGLDQGNPRLLQLPKVADVSEAP
jgi:hypothetical protein